MHMLNRIIFLLIISIGISVKGNVKDTTHYMRPFIGYQDTFALFLPCSESLKYSYDDYFLNRILEWKPAVDSFILLLEVHTDCRGDSNATRLYTQKKADSLVAYLKRKCHDSIVVIGLGMGESQLVNHCKCEGEIKVPCNEGSHQENRRIVFKIIGRREL